MEEFGCFDVDELYLPSAYAESFARGFGHVPAA